MRPSKTFVSSRNTMRECLFFYSKIDWKKSEALNELFVPFADLER